MKGSSYIKLPPNFQNAKKGLINLQNSDECFRWCHVRLINPVERNPRRIKKSDKIIAKQLNYTGIEFPVTIKQIPKIEKQNSIRVNVFGYENKKKFPIHIGEEKLEKTLNLLLIKKGDKDLYIKDFNSSCSLKRNTNTPNNSVRTVYSASHQSKYSTSTQRIASLLTVLRP